MDALTLPSEIIVSQTSRESQHDHYKWLNYFDPRIALQDFINYMETLPSSRTPERSTFRVYLASVADFFRYCGVIVERHSREDYTFDFDRMIFPSAAVVQAFIGFMLKRGNKSATAERHLAAIRLYLKALKSQDIQIQGGEDFVFMWQAIQQLDLALDIKRPKSDVTSNRPALENYGTRLNLPQVNQLFAYFGDKMDTLNSKRDLALMYLGITSGLRAAELCRITLNDIRRGDDCWEVKVRGKRNNYDPIGIDNEAYDLLMQWITAFNDGLADDDPRRITNDMPIFQPLLRSGIRCAAGSYDPRRGISPRAVLLIVRKHTLAALSFKIGAHDMRRTCAYLMRNNGFEWEEIRTQLRHRSLATTEKYVGRHLDLSRSLLSKRAHFDVPHLGGAA